MSLAAPGRLAKFIHKDQPGRVASPDVVLDVESNLGGPDQRDPGGERVRAIEQRHHTAAPALSRRWVQREPAERRCRRRLDRLGDCSTLARRWPEQDMRGSQYRDDGSYRKASPPNHVIFNPFSPSVTTAA